MSSRAIQFLVQDWSANRGHPKSQILLLAFRMTQLVRGDAPAARRAAFPALVFYRLLSEWFLSVDLPAKTRVGPRLRIFHAHGIVVNADCVLGSDVVLRHNCTIGARSDRDRRCPRLGDRVDVGAGAAILGGVDIGADAKIGALALVMEDIPLGAVALAPKARVVSRHTLPSERPPTSD